MAYSDYSLKRARRELLVEFVEDDLFAELRDISISPILRETLDENIPLATAIHTEKARSELIISPILLEARRRLDRRIGFFSGTTLDVDPNRGLVGCVDFLLARSPLQAILREPAFVIVQAKDDNIQNTLGECVAAMFASQLYNERAGEGPGTIYGAVTTGSQWRFLKLERRTVTFQRAELTINHPGQILAALIVGVGDPSAPSKE